MLAPGPLTKDAEGLPYAIDLPVVLLDGIARDRCPYVGDQAVSGMTLLVSPVPGEITLPADGAATLDGKSIPAQWSVTSVQIPSGTHTLVV